MMPPYLGTNLFQDAGAPLEDFPSSSWAGAAAKVPPQMDLHGQFGTIVIPGNATACVAAQTHIHEEFQCLNQDWIVKPHPDRAISTDSPFLYELHTLAKNFKALAGGNLSIGALAVVQWVVGTSDGGNPTYSKPVVLVLLGPLIAPTQQENNMSYNLDELGLLFDIPAQPLGKE